MNKDQLARLARHYKVKQTLADNAAAVADVPALTKLAAQYLAQLALLDGTAQRNPPASEGATQVKNTASAALQARLLKAASALYLFYKANGPAADAAALHRRASDYTDMTELELATAAHDLSERAANRAKDLADYNLSATDITALATDAASFDAMLPAPQLAIDAAKIKGATARTTLSALNAFLKDDLRAGMELLRDTHPAAYAALREASQVDDARYRKGGKKGRKEEKAIARPALIAGIKTVFIEEDGNPVWLDLTINTLCLWRFTLPPSIDEQSDRPGQPHGGPHRERVYANPPASLIGASYVWNLVLDNADDEAQPYSGTIRLVQGVDVASGQEIYSEDIDPESIPAAPTEPVTLHRTLQFLAA